MKERILRKKIYTIMPVQKSTFGNRFLSINQASPATFSSSAKAIFAFLPNPTTSNNCSANCLQSFTLGSPAFLYIRWPKPINFSRFEEVEDFIASRYLSMFSMLPILRIMEMTEELFLSPNTVRAIKEKTISLQQKQAKNMTYMHQQLRLGQYKDQRQN